MRVEFLVRRSYYSYNALSQDKEGWRSGGAASSKFPKVVRWPVKLSWKIFQRDMVRLLVTFFGAGNSCNIFP
jgi:hypothetical protein